tara:strand:+ start:269 stop:1072 length:804 start_codon:yes stop_codon:yes gene_type:complete
MMSRFSELRDKAKQCLDEIFATPLVCDQSTQTDDAPSEDLKSILKKRKAEFWDIFDEVLNGEDTVFSRHVIVHPGKGFKRTPESRAGTLSDISDNEEPDEQEDDHLSARNEPSDSSTAATSKADTNIRQKLMRELAKKRNINVSAESALNILFRGQSNEQLIEQLEATTPPALPVNYTLQYETMMEFAKIEPNTYANLDKDTQRRYIAGIMDELFTLIIKHKTKPTSLRAISNHYNTNYDHIYDVWRGRSTNPYLTVSLPPDLQNLR